MRVSKNKRGKKSAKEMERARKKWRESKIVRVRNREEERVGDHLRSVIWVLAI